MVRKIEAEMETTAAKVKTALDRFFKKYPELDYWGEQFEYMYENHQDFCCDNLMANGEKNPNWCYALHLNVNEHFYDNKFDFYICVIERI